MNDSKNVMNKFQQEYMRQKENQSEKAELTQSTESRISNPASSIPTAIL